MSKRRYEKGKRICSMAEFEASKADWFIWRDKTTNIGVLISLQYRTLQKFIYMGMIWEAKKKEE